MQSFYDFHKAKGQLGQFNDNELKTLKILSDDHDTHVQSELKKLTAPPAGSPGTKVIPPATQAEVKK